MLARFPRCSPTHAIVESCPANMRPGGIRIGIIDVNKALSYIGLLPHFRCKLLAANECMVHTRHPLGGTRILEAEPNRHSNHRTINFTIAITATKPMAIP